MSVSQPHPGSRNDKHIVKLDAAVTNLVEKSSWLKNINYTLFDKDGNTKQTQGVYFICDGGYLKWPQLICPIQGHCLDQNEYDFTKVVERTRIDVECCFGMLKIRWKIIKYAMRYRDLIYCHRIFVTCCILHNMMVKVEDYNTFEIRSDDIRGLPNYIENHGYIWIGDTPIRRQEYGQELTRKQTKDWKQKMNDLMEHVHYCRKTGCIN